MVWGAISKTGVHHVCKVSSSMNADEYGRILRNNVRPILRQLPADTIFQQDNDPKHTARVNLEWILQNTRFHLDWPSQSPDQSCA